MSSVSFRLSQIYQDIVSKKHTHNSSFWGNMMLFYLLQCNWIMHVQMTCLACQWMLLMPYQKKKKHIFCIFFLRGKSKQCYIWETVYWKAFSNRSLKKCNCIIIIVQCIQYIVPITLYTAAISACSNKSLCTLFKLLSSVFWFINIRNTLEYGSWMNCL